VIWHEGVPTLLAANAAFGSEAVAINNAGQVAGNIFTVNAVDPTAVVWNNGVPTLLPSPSAQYTMTHANSLNAAGQVVGEAIPAGIAGQEAVVWNGTTPTVPDTKAGCSAGSYATGINSHGTIVGVTECPSDDETTVWRGTTATLLGAGNPNAVNDSGLIVGVGLYGATVWVDGVIKHLVGARSAATAVNDLGIIVGKVPGNRLSYHAAVWSSLSAAPQDLNTMIGTAAGKYVLTAATGINGSCTIVANGFLITDTVNIVAFLLKPLDQSKCVKGGF